MENQTQIIQEKFSANNSDIIYLIKTDKDGRCAFIEWKFANIDKQINQRKIILNFIPNGFYDGELAYFDEELKHVDDRPLFKLVNESEEIFKEIKEDGLTRTLEDNDYQKLFKKRDEVLEYMSNPKKLNKIEDEEYIKEKREILKVKYNEICQEKSKLKAYLKQK